MAGESCSGESDLWAAVRLARASDTSMLDCKGVNNAMYDGMLEMAEWSSDLRW